MHKDLSRSVQEFRVLLFPVKQKIEINISRTADPEVDGRIKISVRVTSLSSQMFFNKKYRCCTLLVGR